MDYLCAKFGDFSFSRFGFIVRTDTQTDRQTDRQTEEHDCFKPGFHYPSSRPELTARVDG